jgi:uncharacterized damage-inducible protein DinB
MATTYRPGAKGALLDEYERAIADLKNTIEHIPDALLKTIVDKHTSDENCKSVQSVLIHVVHSGYGYATHIINLRGYNKERPAKAFHKTIQAYLNDLQSMFIFTEAMLSQFDEHDVEQLNESLKIKSGWGQTYDIEQMMEHAIVHVLRHRRQLEKFKLLLHL